jgi:alkaline phosphatase
VMVPIFSYGPGAERFSGIHDNTFFFEEFLKSLKIKR